jgi:hypothetical protein
MKTNLASALVLVLFSTLNSELSTALAQGSLTPPGSPAPTMKSLAQIEARTPISSAPFLITSSGSYYLTTNVSVSTGNAITIGANGVSLDLNGFTISSTAPSATGDGIQLSPSVRDVTIVNGHIRSGVVNSSGVYSGSGFAFGIAYLLNPPANVLVSHVTVSGCLDDGIFLNTGDSTVVESCTVRTVGSEGIYASTIKESSAADCGNDAIYGDQVADCRGDSTGSGAGINANSTVQNCYGFSNGGFGINAVTAQNSYGLSTNDVGISTYTAQNCYGETEGSSEGVSSLNATGCYCLCLNSSGIALSASVANNCVASCVGGTAINAKIAIGCYTADATVIVNKYNMP